MRAAVGLDWIELEREIGVIKDRSVRHPQSKNASIASNLTGQE